MEKFYVEDVPNYTNVAAYMMKHTDWKEKMATVKPRQEYPNLLCFAMEDFDPHEISNDIYEAMDIYGRHGWNTVDGPLERYGGFSLVYNPYHVESPDPHESTLGTKKNKGNQFFYGNIENHDVIKNTYYDSYGFNTPTPASNHKSLGKFMARSRRTRIRSRLAIIDSRYPVIPNAGWHRDEPIFENLRINIPILTNENYLFELEGHSPIHLSIGLAYTWDTNLPHRVFNSKTEDSERIHLVLGFSPWWDHVPEENAWVKNEFYGKKHPYDMLVDGDIFSGLKFMKETDILN